MVEPTQFELEGRRFEVKRLSPDDACLSLELIGKALGPAAIAVLGGEAPDYGKVLTALLSNASQISGLLKLFAPAAKFDRAGNGTMVELKPFVSDVFAGRVDLMVAFLAHCVRAEHSCFLGGPNVLAELLQQMTASASESPRAPTR
jgi:hypothetical protein